MTLGTNVKVFNTYRREGKAGRSHFLNHKPWGMRLMPGKAALVGLCLWGSLVPSWVPLPNTQVLVLPRPSDPPCAPHSPLGSICNLCFHPLDRLVFHRANVFNFDEVSFIKFFFFFFYGLCFYVMSKNSSPSPRSRRSSLTFSSKSLRTCSFTFKSVIYSIFCFRFEA